MVISTHRVYPTETHKKIDQMDGCLAPFFYGLVVILVLVILAYVFTR